MSETTSGAVGVCDSCGARFRVRSATKSYACKKCGGVVSAAAPDADLDDEPASASSPSTPRSSGADPYAAPTAPASRRRTQRSGAGREADEHGEYRRKRARANKNTKNAINFINNVLLVAILFSALRVLAMALLLSEGMAGDGGPGRVDDTGSAMLIVELLIEVGVLALLVLTKKNLREFPVGLILAVAIVKSIGFVASAGPLILDGSIAILFSTEVITTGIGATVAGMFLIATFWTGFFWYAYFTVKKNRAIYEELKEQEPPRRTPRR